MKRNHDNGIPVERQKKKLEKSDLLYNKLLNFITMAKNNFGSIKENEVTREEFPLSNDTKSSATAQCKIFDGWKKFREAAQPVFDELYTCSDGIQRPAHINKKPDYREKLEEELCNTHYSERWTTALLCAG